MVLDKSFEQLEGRYQTCFSGNAMETFLESVKMSQDDDCLNLEDDIILCNDFLKRVKAVIDRHPDKVITFFTLKDRPMGENIESGRTFCMNQCVYMPKWFNQTLLRYSDTWLASERGKKNPTAYDYMMGDMLNKIGQTYILYQPSLVQHMEMKSRIAPRRSTKRQSKTFVK